MGNRDQARTGQTRCPADFADAILACGFQALPITIAHALTTETLPLLHRDPFDRLLIAQSLVEGATLITQDPQIPKYGVPTLIV